MVEYILTPVKVTVFMYQLNLEGCKWRRSSENNNVFRLKCVFSQVNIL